MAPRCGTRRHPAPPSGGHESRFAAGPGRAATRSGILLRLLGSVCRPPAYLLHLHQPPAHILSRRLIYFTYISRRLIHSHQPAAVRRQRLHTHTRRSSGTRAARPGSHLAPPPTRSGPGPAGLGPVHATPPLVARRLPPPGARPAPAASESRATEAPGRQTWNWESIKGLGKWTRTRVSAKSPGTTTRTDDLECPCRRPARRLGQDPPRRRPGRGRCGKPLQSGPGPGEGA